MWKYRLDFNLSYDELFVNIGFVFCTWEHYRKQYDEIWCIDGNFCLNITIFVNTHMYVDAIPVKIRG